jgi:RimJ/RimL family protein N-acetyltransferase
MCSIRVEPRIETERLVLTPASADYVDRLIPIINDFDIARMTTRIPYPYGQAEADAFRQHLALTDISRDSTLQIETRDGELIGAVGAHLRDNPFPEIGYWIARGHWGKGYATEAAIAIRDWARRAFNCRALIAGHFADNEASGRVLVKCGFLYTGEVQRRFSLARGEDAATRMMVWLA